MQILGILSVKESSGMKVNRWPHWHKSKTHHTDFCLYTCPHMELTHTEFIHTEVFHIEISDSHRVFHTEKLLPSQKVGNTTRFKLKFHERICCLDQKLNLANCNKLESLLFSISQAPFMFQSSKKLWGTAREVNVTWWLRVWSRSLQNVTEKFQYFGIQNFCRRFYFSEWTCWTSAALLAFW